jgi:hypothetical protein
LCSEVTSPMRRSSRLLRTIRFVNFRRPWRESLLDYVARCAP